MNFFNIFRWPHFALFIIFSSITITSVSVLIKINALNDEKHAYLLKKSELIAILENETKISEENKDISNKNLREIDELKNQNLTVISITNASTTPIECYLNLQQELESLRKAAEANHIILNPRCTIGLEKNEQSQIISMLIRTLIDSQPKEILLIQREPVNNEDEKNVNLFRLPKHQRLDIHNIFSSNAFKISFTGTTENLRSFVNRIESTALIFIRDIEVNKKDEHCAFSVTLEVLTIT